MKPTPTIGLLLTLLLILSCTTRLSANNLKISGIVIDAKTKQPLPFANIVLGERVTGTVANADGYFVLVIDSLYIQSTVSFSYMGYHSREFAASKLSENEEIKLKPASINLKEVEISARELTIKEILRKVSLNFEKNHKQGAVAEQKVFLHSLENVPLKDKAIIKIKESDFEGLDKNTIEELMAMMPDEIMDYNDAILNLYSNGSKNKIVPIEAISLQEGSLKDLEKEFEEKLEPFINSFMADADNDDVYYKIRSGIFAGKIDKPSENDSSWKSEDENPNHIEIGSESLISNISSLKEEFADIEQKDLDFIEDPGKYHYTKDISIVNDELVYKIHFEPKINGTFVGDIYISRTDFGILQLDYAYAEGKRGKHFQLLGIGYAEKFKKAHVIFEKGANDHYFVKYINANKNELISVERRISFKKKEKRKLINKELNELKVKLDLTFDTYNYYEYLVINRNEITKEKFNDIEQPENVLYKKEYVYSPEMWDKPTVIVPSKELKKYKRK